MIENQEKLAYDYDEDDFDAFQNYFFWHSSFNRRRMLLWQLAAGFGGSVLPLAVGIFLIANRHSFTSLVSPVVTFIAIVWGAGYGVYALFFLREHMRKSTLKRTKKFHAAHSVDPGYGKRRLRIENDSIVSEWPLGNGTLTIAKMKEPIETDTHIFFFIDGAQALIVPKRKISEGNVESFVKEFVRIRNNV